jgi:hypothetical protein
VPDESLLAAALEYVERGWPVFPLSPRSKIPLAGSHGCLDASTDPERIKSWWDRTPDANVGLATGHRFDVLDVDDPEGWTSLARMTDQHGCLPATMITLTPTHGCHYFFLPTGRGNRAGILPGLDWRGRGGYVVAPPSYLETGWTDYEWLVRPDDDGAWPLKSAPAWCLQEKRSVTKLPMGQGCGQTPLNGDRYGEVALDGEISRVALAPEGQRNDVLNSAAFNLGQLVAVGKLDIGTVVDSLTVAGERAGLSPREVAATVESGFRAGLAKPR